LSCLLNSEKQESTNYLQCFFCPFGDHSIMVLKTTTCWTGVPIVIHINYFMGAITLFFSFSFLKGPHRLAHHQVFGNIGHSPLESPCWTASCKIRTNLLHMAHLFSLYTYMRVELWANPMA
jgi:hypothetical protein